MNESVAITEPLANPIVEDVVQDGVRGKSTATDSPAIEAQDPVAEAPPVELIPQIVSVAGLCVLGSLLVSVGLDPLVANSLGIRIVSISQYIALGAGVLLWVPLFYWLWTGVQRKSSGSWNIPLEIPLICSGVASLAAAATSISEGTIEVAGQNALLIAVISGAGTLRWHQSKVLRVVFGAPVFTDSSELEASHGVPTTEFGPGATPITEGRIVSGVALIAEREFGGAHSLVQRGPGEVLLSGSTVLHGQLKVAPLNRVAEGHFFRHLPHVRKGCRQLAGLYEAPAQLSSLLSLVLLTTGCSAMIFHSDHGRSWQEVFSLGSSVFGLAVMLQVALAIQHLRGVLPFRCFLDGVYLKAAKRLPDYFRVRTACLDLASSAPECFEYELEEASIMTDSVDSRTVTSVVISIASGARGGVYRDLANHLLRKFPTFTPREVSQFHHYSGRGICALVGGVDVTLGSESFLIERGVYVQQSEVLDSNACEEAPVLYLALNDAVVARFQFAPLQQQGRGRFVSEVERRRWTAVIRRGEESFPEVDARTLVFSNDSLILQNLAGSCVTATALSELTDDPTAADLVCAGRLPARVPSMLVRLNRHYKAGVLLWSLTLIGFVGFLPLALFGLIGSLIVLSSAAALVALAWVLKVRLERSVRSKVLDCVLDHDRATD